MWGVEAQMSFLDLPTGRVMIWCYALAKVIGFMNWVEE